MTRTASAHRRQRCLQAGLFWFVVGYFPLAAALKLVGPPSGQVFPLSSWSLYSRVPNHAVVYVVRVIGTGKTLLPSPIDLQDFSPAGARARGPWAHHAIQRLGRAASGGDGKGLEALRVTFEETYLQGEEPIHYLLVRRRLDPLAYLHTRAVEEESVLGGFVTRARIR
jgi:hypothetical protein